LCAPFLRFCHLKFIELIFVSAVNIHRMLKYKFRFHLQSFMLEKSPLRKHITNAVLLLPEMERHLFARNDGQQIGVRRRKTSAFSAASAK
jgi:hypothetical protein